MKYYSTSFTVFGFDSSRNAISTGNVVTNAISSDTRNSALASHFENLRHELYIHAKKSLNDGFPVSSTYTIVISIFDSNLMKTKFINIKKNILHIFKNYDKDIYLKKD